MLPNQSNGRYPIAGPSTGGDAGESTSRTVMNAGSHQVPELANAPTPSMTLSELDQRAFEQARKVFDSVAPADRDRGRHKILENSSDEVRNHYLHSVNRQDPLLTRIFRTVRDRMRNQQHRSLEPVPQHQQQQTHDRRQSNAITEMYRLQHQQTQQSQPFPAAISEPANLERQRISSDYLLNAPSGSGAPVRSTPSHVSRTAQKSQVIERPHLPPTQLLYAQQQAQEHCQGCLSSAHATSACTFGDQREAELQARASLSATPIFELAVSQGQICSFHREGLNEMIRRDPAQPGGPLAPQMPLAFKVFDCTILDETALFPVCDDCRADSGLQQDNEIDTCLCATRITTRGCMLCEVARITAAKGLARQKRSSASAIEPPSVACACGRPVSAAKDVLRKCVGCYGFVTAAFSSVKSTPCEFTPGTLRLQAAQHDHTSDARDPVANTLRVDSLDPSGHTGLGEGDDASRHTNSASNRPVDSSVSGEHGQEILSSAVADEDIDPRLLEYRDHGVEVWPFSFDIGEFDLATSTWSAAPSPDGSYPENVAQGNTSQHYGGIKGDQSAVNFEEPMVSGVAGSRVNKGKRKAREDGSDDAQLFCDGPMQHNLLDGGQGIASSRNVGLGPPQKRPRLDAPVSSQAHSDLVSTGDLHAVSAKNTPAEALTFPLPDYQGPSNPRPRGSSLLQNQSGSNKRSRDALDEGGQEVTGNKRIRLEELNEAWTSEEPWVYVESPSTNPEATVDPVLTRDFDLDGEGFTKQSVSLTSAEGQLSSDELPSSVVSLHEEDTFGENPIWRPSHQDLFGDAVDEGQGEAVGDDVETSDGRLHGNDIDGVPGTGFVDFSPENIDFLNGLGFEL